MSVLLHLQKNEARTFPEDFRTRKFLRQVNRYAATTLTVALSPSHNDINSFRPWSPIATGKHLDCAEKIPNLAQTTSNFEDFDSRSGILVHTSS